VLTSTNKPLIILLLDIGQRLTIRNRKLNAVKRYENI